MYYGLVGQEVFDGQHLISDILYKGILSVLMATCLTTWTATVYHERVSKQKLETMIPQSVNYYIGVACAVVGFTLLGETLQILDFSTRWNVYQILITAGEIIISFAIILKSEQLKSHSIRFIKNKVDDAFLMSIILVPALLSGLIYGLLSIIYTLIVLWKNCWMNLSLLINRLFHLCHKNVLLSIFVRLNLLLHKNTNILFDLNNVEKWFWMFTLFIWSGYILCIT